MSGLFITFEGCDGCGKSTQIKMLTQALTKLGIKVAVTREPGGCPISERLRDMVLDSANSELAPMTELLIYEAARAQHVAQVIKPALERGETVICDRFTHSTVAYQGWGRGFDIGMTERLNQAAVQGVEPDLTVMLLLNPELAFNRKGGADKTDRIEQAGDDFHRVVYKGYCSMAHNKNVLAVDVADKTRYQTAALLLDEVLRRLK